MYIKKIVLSLLGCGNLTRFKCECGSDEFISEPNGYDVVTFEDGEVKIRRREIIDTSTYYCRECGKEYEDGDGKLVLLEINKE